jgi:HK97 family phage prohead protease
MKRINTAMNNVYERGIVLRRPADGSRVVTFRASTPSVDRHGTRIIPMGIDTTQFDANPVFLWGHDGYGGVIGPSSLSSVIGRVVSHRKTESAFDIDVEFAPPDVNETADQALRLVRSGFLNAVSIGFSPRKWHEERIDDGRQITVFDEVDLLEVSLVPIPSNPDAVALTRHLFGSHPDVEQLRAVDTLLRVGKVLSSANKGKLRNAVQLINEVLASAEDDDVDETRAARAIRLHGAGEEFARELIDAGAVNIDDPWEFTPDDGNALLGSDGDDWSNYGRHHLARETDAGEDTKDGWRYPFAKLVDGDSTLFRSALIAIRQRAGQQGHTTVFDAAGRLIEAVDSMTQAPPAQAAEHGAVAAADAAIKAWLAERATERTLRSRK